MIDMKDYGVSENMGMLEAMELARITAVHRERFEIICSRGEGLAVVKNSVYYNEGSEEIFPVIGDFVWVDYNPSGLSRIVKTLERK